jgi:hypothetical protein
VCVCFHRGECTCVFVTVCVVLCSKNHVVDIFFTTPCVDINPNSNFISVYRYNAHLLTS